MTKQTCFRPPSFNKIGDLSIDISVSFPQTYPVLTFCIHVIAYMCYEECV